MVYICSLFVVRDYDALLRAAETTQQQAYRPGTQQAHRRAIKVLLGFSVYYRKQYLNPHIYPLSVKNVIGALTTASRKASWDHTLYHT